MKSRKKCSILMLAMIMVLSMAADALAVSGAADSDRTDYKSDRTGNSTAERQANSSNTGTIRLGKILTVNQGGKFPNIEDFVYKITPVAAWDNANVSTSKSGRPVDPGDMPKPETSAAVHHDVRTVVPDDPDNAKWAALVTIGNFRNASEDNSSGIYGDKDHKYVNSDSDSNLAKIDKGKRRTRVTDVSFCFDKAGYYMYKIEEAGSCQNGGNDSLNNLRKDVAGVDYDNNSYYVVFYVCNREAVEDVNASQYGQGTRKGDTIGQQGYLNTVNNDGSQTRKESADGVYVHTITSWTNQNANEKAGRDATDYKPDNTMRTSDELADAQNWLNDLMQAQDADPEYSTRWGDGGHDAGLNTGRTDKNGKGLTDPQPGKTNGINEPSTVTHDNLGKVGLSTPWNPDFLEAYRMWNAQVTHDIVLRKDVTGNLGDFTKAFVFEVTLTGLEADQTYTTDIPAGKTDENPVSRSYKHDVTSASVKMYDMQPAACLAADGKSFTTDNTGMVTFKVNLRDDDVLVLNSLPRSASYQIKEQASDHVGQYNIVSTNPLAENGAIFTEKSHTPGGTDKNHLGKANTDAGTELSTETEYIDRFDGTVIITFRNNRDLATLTGLAGLDFMVYAAVLVFLAAGAVFIIRRRREYAEEDDIPA